jgi:hypothetical protein
MLSFRALIDGYSVKWHSDNQAAIPKPELHAIAVDIFIFCKRNDVSLLPEWISREWNTRADVISKAVDYDDWVTTREFFVYMDSLWGPHTVDRFADSFNTQLPRFNSRYYVPGKCVDAFSVCWVGENKWLVPPPYRVIQVIVHIVASRAQGTLGFGLYFLLIMPIVINPTLKTLSFFLVVWGCFRSENIKNPLFVQMRLRVGF